MDPVEKNSDDQVSEPTTLKSGGAPDISIVIVSYNTRDLLRQCLEAIHQFPVRYSFEVLVADNCSADGSYQMVAGEFPSVTALSLEKNIGYSRANNLLIEKTQGRFILLLNPDTRVRQGSLDGLADFLTEHRDAGAVGCQQLDENDQIQLTWGHFPSFRRELVRKAVHHRLKAGDKLVGGYLNNKYQTSLVVDWVSGSCLMVRSEVCDKVGLLDENIFMYFEDIDWCHRIGLNGWRVYYDPNVRIVHHGGVSADRHKVSAMVEYRRSQFYFTRKWYGLRALLVLKCLMTVKALVNLMTWGVKYAFAKRDGRKRQDAREHLLIFWRTLRLIFQ